MNLRGLIQLFFVFVAGVLMLIPINRGRVRGDAASTGRGRVLRRSAC